MGHHARCFAAFKRPNHFIASLSFVVLSLMIFSPIFMLDGAGGLR